MIPATARLSLQLLLTFTICVLFPLGILHNHLRAFLRHDIKQRSLFIIIALEDNPKEASQWPSVRYEAAESALRMHGAKTTEKQIEKTSSSFFYGFLKICFYF